MTSVGDALAGMYEHLVLPPRLDCLQGKRGMDAQDACDLTEKGWNVGCSLASCAPWMQPVDVRHGD
jgi:hypothetical protein